MACDQPCLKPWLFLASPSHRSVRCWSFCSALKTSKTETACYLSVQIIKRPVVCELASTFISQIIDFVVGDDDGYNIKLKNRGIMESIIVPES